MYGSDAEMRIRWLEMQMAGLARRLDDAKVTAGAALQDAQFGGGNGGGGGGSFLSFYETPGGGIPAASGLTPGSATCTEYTFGGTSFSSTSNTATVFNVSTSAVAASKLVVCGEDSDGNLFVLVEPC